MFLQVKRALPLLLSSMKAFVTLKREKRKGAAEAQENRSTPSPFSLLPPSLFFHLAPFSTLFLCLQHSFSFSSFPFRNFAHQVQIV